MGVWFNPTSFIPSGEVETKGETKMEIGKHNAMVTKIEKFTTKTGKPCNMVTFLIGAFEYKRAMFDNAMEFAGIEKPGDNFIAICRGKNDAGFIEFTFNKKFD